MRRMKYLERVVVLCMALFLLSGCVFGETKESRAADENIVPETAGSIISVRVETPEFTEVPLGTVFNSIHGILPYGNGVTVIGTKDGTLRLLNMDSEGNHAESIPLEEPDGAGQVYDVGCDGDESIYVLYGISGGDGQTGVNLITYDHQGNLLAEQGIPVTRSYMRGPVVMDDGTKLIWNEENIIVCGKDDSNSFTPFSSGETILSVSIDEGQRCHATVTKENKTGLFLFDPDTGETKEESFQEDAVHPAYTRCRNAGGTVFFNTAERLMEYDPENNNLIQRFEWGALPGTQINHLIELGKNRFACMNAITPSLYFISTVEKNTERKVIVIGTLHGYTTGKLERFVSFFNMHNEDYYAKIKYYYEEPDLLRAEWVTQDVPSVVNVYDLDIPQNDALFVDLLPYLERGEDITKDDITESMLRSFLCGGKLYVIPSAVQIETLIARAADVGDTMGWSMEEMQDFLAQKGDVFFPFPGWLTPIELMRWLISSDLGRFVDWEKGECSFDSQAFINELVLCKEKTPETYQPSPNSRVGFNGNDVLLDPQCLQAVNNFPPVLRCAFEGEPLTFIGFPNPNGNNGSYFCEESFGMLLGIPANAPDKEGAWEIIKVMLSEDWQREEDCFPVNRKVLEEQMQGLKQDTMYTDVPLTDEEIEKCRKLINGTEIYLREDVQVATIIGEEAEGFFSGKQTAEEAAKIIQSRVTLYLQEQFQ